MNGNLPVAVSWLALANAMFTAFAASFYMGLMLVVRFFLQPAWKSLTLETVDVYFGRPIAGATKFLRIMFVPYLLSAGLLVWIGWGNAAAVASAWIATACYALLAVWFQWKMAPVNARLLSGEIADQAELDELIEKWGALNQVRVLTTVVYWLGALAFLVSAHHLWEGLS